jgi:hypothetical protein
MQPMSQPERHSRHTHGHAAPAVEEEVEPMTRQATRPAESALQRIADASIWLLFRLTRVRS